MQRGDAEMRDPGEPAADRFGIAWMAQPAGQARGEVQLLQLGQYQRRGKEVGGDEARQVAADARLAARDDRRMGIGRPSGWRNRAVTANQSAIAPTMAASAKEAT